MSYSGRVVAIAGHHYTASAVAVLTNWCLGTTTVVVVGITIDA